MNEEIILEKIYQFFLKKKSVKIDSKKIKKGDIFFGIRGKNFDGNIFGENALENGASLVVFDNQKIFERLKKKIEKNKDKKIIEKNLEKIILVKDCQKTLQNLAKKYRKDLKIPFLAITGSNGKTTTKELLKKVLEKKFKVLATKGNLNNHIGVPLTILSIKKNHEFSIIEMGANHVGEIKILAEIASPDFGIITNIGSSHIGEFGSFSNILKTKKQLYDFVFKNNGKIFINKEDKILEKASKNFKEKNKIFYPKGEILDEKDFLEIKIKNKKIKTKIVGGYNLENFLAAFCVAEFFKISQENIIDALEKYSPKNNRSETQKTKNKNQIIWDCYNSNPTSIEKAINSFKKKDGEKIFILGGMKELGKWEKKEHKKVLENLEKIDGKKIFIGAEFLKLKNKKENFFFLKELKELEKFLKKEKFKNKKILIKGSNSSKLFELKNKNLI